ncbi:MAG: carboxylesterase/lipase family protein [Steroidobacteraceae bacterium]
MIRLHRSLIRSSGVLVLAALWLGFTSFEAAAAHANPDKDLAVVITNRGSIKGTVAEGYRQFLGVPYAAPPIGPLRWAPPQPAAAWDATLDARSFRSKCTQSTWAPPTVTQGGEDCLYLNVYTPVSGKGHGKPVKPVMVWFHGGAFVGGSSQDVDGHLFAVKGDVVVVTVNYRLGVFGFFDSPALDAENPKHVSGNYGILDQQAALRWVQDNIRAFGGDPAQVTIAGQSAGAVSDWIHLVAPSSGGLFGKMIAESGPVLLQPSAGMGRTDRVAGMRSRQEDETKGPSSRLISALGCDGAPEVLACIRSKPTQAVFDALPVRSAKWGPVIDGVLLPDTVPALIRRGAYKKIPILMGGTRGESGFGVLSRLANGGKPLTEEAYKALVSARPNGKRILAEYPASKYSSADDASIRADDDGFVCSSLRTAEVLSVQVPLYMYEFQDNNPPGTIFNVTVPATVHTQAFHTAEISYVFQTGYPNESRPGLPPFSMAQKTLSDRMIQYWSNFVQSGQPESTWKPFSSTAAFLLLRPEGDAPVAEDQLLAEHRCAFWASL